jgi:MFS family permease
MSDVVMSAELTNAEKIRGLRWSIAQTAANTVFSQLTFFGPAFILFLNELQLSNSQIGLLLSFFPFFGTIALFIAPRVARFGYKRTFVLFWGIRKTITALLLLVPWVLDEFGSQVTLIFVGLIVMGFGLCRAIAEVGYYPWSQEFVPTSMRGRYESVAQLFTNGVGIITIAFASFIIEQLAGLHRFTLLFGIGVVFGYLSLWFTTRVPGGAPTTSTGAEALVHRDMLVTLKDKNFWLFILSVGLVTLGTTPMFSFLPLFMKQEVGLSDGNNILLQNGVLIGALSVTLIMGWSSDRYGSKPVMLTGITMMMILPIIWLFIPKHSSLSLPIALTAALIQGAATLTWAIGFARLLFVNVVPQEQKAPYMAVYYAAIGVIGGVSQLFGGVILDVASDLSGNFLSYSYGQFTVVFVLGLAALIISQITFRYVPYDTSVSSGQFASMFMQGNPVLAFESMIRYYRAKDERAAINMTERLGQAHSPLTIDELLEALIDPRFNVRFEALVSIARSTPDPQLGAALANILHGTELTLSMAAAWALGRIGDKGAQDALRQGLYSEYRGIRAHCARSLGSLGDESIAPLLLERLESETDKGLKMAYASALGSLMRREATPVLLNLLEQFDNEGARMELALSLARITGEEKHFIRILRQVRRDPGTIAAQTLETVQRKFANGDVAFDECITLWASDQTDAGSTALAALIRQLPDGAFDQEQRLILAFCARQLETTQDKHAECLILALFTLYHAGKS